MPVLILFEPHTPFFPNPTTSFRTKTAQCMGIRIKPFNFKINSEIVECEIEVVNTRRNLSFIANLLSLNNIYAVPQNKALPKIDESPKADVITDNIETPPNPGTTAARQVEEINGTLIKNHSPSLSPSKDIDSKPLKPPYDKNEEVLRTPLDRPIIKTPFPKDPSSLRPSSPKDVLQVQLADSTSLPNTRPTMATIQPLNKYSTHFMPTFSDPIHNIHPISSTATTTKIPKDTKPIYKWILNPLTIFAAAALAAIIMNKKH